MQHNPEQTDRQRHARHQRFRQYNRQAGPYQQRFQHGVRRRYQAYTRQYPRQCHSKLKGQMA